MILNAILGGVLDIDSTRFDDFSVEDKDGLEHIIQLLMAEIEDLF